MLGVRHVDVRVWPVVVSTVYGNKVWRTYRLRLHILRATLARRPRIRSRWPVRGVQSTGSTVDPGKHPKQKTKSLFVFLTHCKCTGETTGGGGGLGTVPRSPLLLVVVVVGCDRACSFARDRCGIYAYALLYVYIYTSYAINVASAT